MSGTYNRGEEERLLLVRGQELERRGGCRGMDMR